MSIAIEGLDFAGKSTQISLLKQVHPEWKYTSEPSLVIKEQVQSYGYHSPKARSLQLMADRAEHYNRLKNVSNLIVTDRSIVSGWGYTEDIPIELYRALHADIEVLPCKVELCILLRMSTQTYLDRFVASSDSIERRPVYYHMDVQKRMIEYTKHLNIPLVEIDATLDSIEIHILLLQAIELYRDTIS